MQLLKIMIGCVFIFGYTSVFAYYKDAPVKTRTYTQLASTCVTCVDYYSDCECTDPACGNKAYNDCLSRCECCEAFGNIGAR